MCQVNIIERLGQVLISNVTHRFQFNDDLAVNKNISDIISYIMAFIIYCQRLLSFKGYAHLLKFYAEYIFVHFFRQPLTQYS